MVPTASDGRAPTSARLVRADDAFLGSDDGIDFWRGVDSHAIGTQAFLARARCPAGTRIGPHRHSEDTVAYLADGKASTTSMR